MAIVAIIVVIGIAGLGFLVKGYGDSKMEEGRAECKAAVEAANKLATDAAGKLAAETQKHIEDMTTAYAQGEAEAKKRVIYVTTKGATDVAAHPEVFKNVACTLPADALRNLNAARSGLRREPPADVVRVDVGAGPGTAARPAANPSGTPPSVRGTAAAAKGDAGGNVSTDASGRRPLGKVRP